MTGLYVHVPFCKKKCHYCNFTIALSGSQERHGTFLAALERESLRHHGRFKDVSFETVYLGGGTPSSLRSGELNRLFSVLAVHFKWKPDAEITCEVNPGDVDREKAELLLGLGVNRVSFGAQSFHDDTLKRLNRAHDASEITRSYGILRNSGFKNINLDLILSLPGEGWDKVRVSLEKAVKLSPEHISLYELTVETKTVFGDLHEKGRLRLPDEETQFETLSKAREFLKSQGYAHYELLNYAKPGFESRHNRLYWANHEYLGLGPGAYSYIDGRRSRFAESYASYLSKIRAGDWTASEEEVLSPGNKEIESFLLALRLSEGASAARFENVLGSFGKDLTDLLEKGLLLHDNGRIRLSQKGQFLAESVFTQLSSC
jgi:oxygen-independent coproporphyrinogen-3 oxidase